MIKNRVSRFTKLLLFNVVQIRLYSLNTFVFIVVNNLLLYIYTHNLILCIHLEEKMVRHNNQLPENLPQLQNLIKRDPESYKEEVSIFSAICSSDVINIL